MVIAPYLLCQAATLSNLVQAVADPVTATVNALQSAKTHDFGEQFWLDDVSMIRKFKSSLNIFYEQYF